MGAVAAGRRTRSSFAQFLTSTNPSQLRIGTDAYNPAVGSDVGYSSILVKKIAHLPHVGHVESAALLDVVPFVGPNGPGPNNGPAAGDPTNLNTIGSVNGLYFDEDRTTITKGRMADTSSPDEIVVQASQAQGVHVGQVITFGVYTNPEEAQPGFNPARSPFRRIDVKAVGFGVSNEVS